MFILDLRRHRGAATRDRDAAARARLGRPEPETRAMEGRDYERDALVFRALANESRLKIVERLRGEQACVCELTEMLGLDQSTVSKHLTVLKAAGIVSGARRGNHIYYRLLAPCVLNLLDCAASVHMKEDRDATAGGACAEPASTGRSNG